MRNRRPPTTTGSRSHPARPQSVVVLLTRMCTLVYFERASAANCHPAICHLRLDARSLTIWLQTINEPLELRAKIAVLIFSPRVFRPKCRGSHYLRLSRPIYSPWPLESAL